ncbi:MAG TPA: hypothetical protein GX717_06390, partial [Clostridiaceae bacterium]|nr:hypothetical protein [Clostridiaceae bacterium]
DTSREGRKGKHEQTELSKPVVTDKIDPRIIKEEESDRRKRGKRAKEEDAPATD